MDGYGRSPRLECNPSCGGECACRLGPNNTGAGDDRCAWGCGNASEGVVMVSPRVWFHPLGVYITREIVSPSHKRVERERFLELINPRLRLDQPAAAAAAAV